MSLKIVSDANIPYVGETFASYGRLILIPGHKIGPETLKNADVLLVRSVTKIDASLLDATSVQFIGSATAGLDHVDLPYIESTGIRLAHAPGGNADSVVEYVLASVFHLATRSAVSVFDRVFGIVGCGEVGGRLAARLSALGFRTLLNDPPKARDAEFGDRAHAFVSLSRVLTDADILSLHVPLNRTGKDATMGLVDASAIARMRPGSWLVNTARGGVVDETGAASARRRGALGALVIDTWAGEPDPDPNAQAQADIATPHIAGYSRDAKKSCTRMIADAMCDHFGLSPAAPDVDAYDLADPEAPAVGATGHSVLAVPAIDPGQNMIAYINRLITQMYRIEEDHRRFQTLPERPSNDRAEAFRRQRWAYPPRWSFGRYRLEDARLSDEQTRRLRGGLGIVV